MKIHSICLVKNEVDIIEQVLKSAAVWSDFIYVYDNGSSDGTWEKILDLVKNYEQIIPYKQDGKAYSDQLRSEAFNHYRLNSSSGDWWCFLDADEMYIDNPKEFLSQIPRNYEVVWSASFQYYFTDRDLALYNQDPSLYADHVPIEEKCRYYLNNWSEIRFFRYKKSLNWDKGKWPKGLGSVYPARIRLKHFQYRSPQQIQKRIDSRVRIGSFKHERLANWKAGMVDTSVISKPTTDLNHFAQSWTERVFESSKLIYDAQDGNYVINESSLPKIPTGSLSELVERVVNKLRRMARSPYLQNSRI